MHQILNRQQKKKHAKIYSNFALSEQLNLSQQKKILLLDKIKQKLEIFEIESNSMKISQQNLNISTKNRAKVQQMVKQICIHPVQKKQNNLIYEGQQQKICLMKKKYQIQQEMIKLNTDSTIFRDYLLQKEYLELEAQLNEKKNLNQQKKVQIENNQGQLHELQTQLQRIKKKIHKNSLQLSTKRSYLNQLETSLHKLKQQSETNYTVHEAVQQKIIQCQETNNVFQNQLIESEATNKIILLQLHILEQAGNDLKKKYIFLKQIFQDKKYMTQNLLSQRQKLVNASSTFQFKAKQVQLNGQHIHKCLQRLQIYS